MATVMEFRNITKRYKNKTVLRETNLVLREGQFNVLSGEGKTTFLKMMAGFESCDEGKVKVLGGDPFDYNFKNRSDVFYIHENYHLFFPKNLLETIKCYRTVFSRWSNDNFNRMLKERRFSIRKNYAELSHSQKMELLVMMALAARPGILLIDELSSFMDEKARGYFLQLLKKYTQYGGTVIISSKDPEEFKDFADQYIVIQNQNIILSARGVSDEQKLVA